MPLVKTHKVLIRGHSDTAQYVPAYELPLVLRKHSGGLKGAKLPAAGKGAEEIPIDETSPAALLTREVSSIEAEFARLVAWYTPELVEKVYPDRDAFVAAVERAILTYSTVKSAPPEIMTRYKSLGITKDQAELAVAAGLKTVIALKGADLAALADALNLPADKAQALRQAWWRADNPTDEVIPVVIPVPEDE